MKKLIITLLAFVLTACAGINTNTTDNNILVLSPKAGDIGEFNRDLDQCKYETSQRHRAKNPQHEALLADCMTAQKGYKLAERK